MRIVYLLIVLLGGLLACQADRSTGQEHTPDTAEKVDGQSLSLQYCGTCHAYPAPALLDKNTWTQHVLPRMGYFMGIYPSDSVRRSLIETGEGGKRVREADIFPKKPLLSDTQWQAIQNFYSTQAPSQLPLPPGQTLLQPLPLFDVKVSPIRLSPPSTTMVKISKDQLLMGDANTKRLYLLDKNLRLKNAANVREGAVAVSESSSHLLLTVMGSFSPTDAPQGMVMALPTNGQAKPAILLDSLQRPVDATYADLDGDGRQDIITCEFAKWTGSLAWWQNQGKGQYQKHVLRRTPGAIKTYVQDFNEDGLLDIIALFGQGDEGIRIYYNQGAGKFHEETVLQFPPSYGSSSFMLFDFNGDGYDDIIYTAGDNADYTPVLKPYHGMYIFLNDGQNHFRQHFFYPMHGAYRAIPADYDQDGDTDFALIAFFPDFSRTPEQSFVYLENQGDLQFQAYTFDEATQGRWIVMDAGDIDQDGDVDIALGSLSFEVIPDRGQLQRWVEQGIPLILLENTLH